MATGGPRIITREEFQERFVQLKPKYDALGKRIVRELQEDVDKAGIKVDAIRCRIKEEEEAWNKQAKKGYRDPFSELEDFCGVRIICLFPSDIQAIAKLLSKRFNAVCRKELAGSVSTTGFTPPWKRPADADRFGYRSQHFIVTLRESAVPPAPELESLKAEIQIRTMLSHAWSELSHGFYKKSYALPQEHQRRLAILSAVLESADEEFDIFHGKRVSYNQTLLDACSEEQRKDFIGAPLTSRTLQTYLDLTFTDWKRDSAEMAKLCEEFVVANVSLERLDRVVRELHGIAEAFMIEATGNYYTWSQARIAKLVMDLDPEWLAANPPAPGDSFRKEFQAFVKKRHHALL